MRTFSLVKICIGSALLIFAGFLISSQILLAQPEQDPFDELNYPIPELDNCESKDACETYCSDSNNIESCLNYAEAHNLLPAEEIEMVRRMIEAGGEGPGGCTGHIECEAYCNEIDHMEECILFAIEHDLMSPEELEEAQGILNAINQGIMPPNGCTSDEECHIYCSQPENMQECIEFSIAAGLIPPEEAEEMQAVLIALEQGVAPPDCYSEEECNVYCALPENTDACIEFFIAAGIMQPEEAEMFRKTGGKGPGDCQGEECKDYCDNPDHMQECMEFALEYGLMSPEDAENTRRMLDAGYTGGPGNCQGHEACEAYCNDITNAIECIEFAETMGFMSSEDAQRSRKMAELGIVGGPGGCQGEEECRSFCENPDNMDACIDFGVKIGDIAPEEAEQMKQGMKTIQQGGPGGCQGEEECKEFCDNPSHVKECIIFSAEHGFMEPERAEMELKQLEMMETMMQEGDMQRPEGYQGNMMPSSEGIEGSMSPEQIIEMEMRREQEEMKKYEEEMMRQLEQFPEGEPSTLLERILGDIAEEFLPAIATIFSF